MRRRGRIRENERDPGSVVSGKASLKVEALKVIVGLGNPGKEYSGSRHNVGFLVVDRFAADHGFPPPKKKRQVHYTEKEIEGERVFLVKPRTYMNVSGGAVRGFLAMCPLQARAGAGKGREATGDDEPGALSDCLLVVHDDLDLPFGKIRYRARGSSGGHRGVASIIREIQTDGFSRLKVGIGRPEGADPADYVLQPLVGSPRKALEGVAARVAATLAVWVREGIEACGNQFNGVRGELGPGSAAGGPGS